MFAARRRGSHAQGNSPSKTRLVTAAMKARHGMLRDNYIVAEIIHHQHASNQSTTPWNMPSGCFWLPDGSGGGPPGMDPVRLQHRRHPHLLSSQLHLRYHWMPPQDLTHAIHAWIQCP